MLDQNTDRMWYVIGAVIIGAAIIFILNGTAPELFASIGGTFEDKAKDTTEVVDGITPNVKHNLFVSSQVNKSGIAGYYSDEVTQYVYENPHTRSFHIPVIPGEEYTVTRSDKRNSRFGYAFSVVEPTVEGTVLSHVSRQDSELTMETVRVPDGVHYFYLYLYDVTATSSDLPTITIYKVN